MPANKNRLLLKVAVIVNPDNNDKYQMLGKPDHEHIRPDEREA